MLDVPGIQEVVHAGSVSYLLDNDAMFYGTGFKILENQNIPCLVPCVRSRWNGRVKLFYSTRGLETGAAHVKASTDAQVRQFLVSLLDGLVAVEDNGFLSMTRVALDAQSVFADPASGMARLVFLPVSVDISGSDEAEVCSRAAELIVSLLSARGGAAAARRALSAFLGAGRSHGLGELASAVGGMDFSRRAEPPAESAGAAGTSCQLGRNGGDVPRGRQIPALRLLAEDDAAMPRQIDLVKPETVIGRSKAKSDCAVLSSTAVSRRHCVLVAGGGGLSVEDLGSANGTFVNGSRLRPHERAALREGDVLTIADVSYRISKEL